MKKLPVTIKQCPDQTRTDVQNTWPGKQKSKKQLHRGGCRAIGTDQLDFPGAHRERLPAVAPMPQVVSGDDDEQMDEQDGARGRDVKVLSDQHVRNDKQGDYHTQRQ